MAERTLRKIVENQRELFAEAAKQGENLVESAFRQQVQSLTHDYELLLRNNPQFAAGYAAYGYLLSKVDMRKEATAMLLKANQLDPDIPLVKNQLGNLLAEDGKPLQAAPYFIAAIRLAPNEPLYHYQLGTLLVEARADFLKAGEWQRDALDNACTRPFAARRSWRRTALSFPTVTGNRSTILSGRTGTARSRYGAGLRRRLNRRSSARPCGCTRPTFCSNRANGTTRRR